MALDEQGPNEAVVPKAVATTKGHPWNVSFEHNSSRYELHSASEIPGRVPQV